MAGYGSPVRVAGYLGLPSQRERDSSLGKEEGTPRDSSPLNLSFPRSRYPLREMNSPDERIWRTVIVSVGAAGISRGGLGRWHKLRARVFKVSPLFYRCSTRGAVVEINWSAGVGSGNDTTQNVAREVLREL